MSNIDPAIRHQQVIPVFESDLFKNNPNAVLAVGMIGVGGEAAKGREAEFKAYLQLRAAVYAHQTGMIPETHVKQDGTETDENDVRSAHFAVIENQGSHNRVIGAMRLIQKTAENPSQLPIEGFFDESFKDQPAPVGSVEFSRYICRHEDGRVQNSLKWHLYAATTGYIAANKLGPSYGVVEEFLKKDFSRNRIPAQSVGAPKFVPEYGSVNIPVLIDAAKVAQDLGVSHQTVDEASAIVFRGDAEQGGKKVAA